MSYKQIYKIFVQILYIEWETNGDNILRSLAKSTFITKQKGRGSHSVRKMNLRSYETSVSIVTQAICTGNFYQFLRHYRLNILRNRNYPIYPNVKFSTVKKVAKILKINL